MPHGKIFPLKRAKRGRALSQRSQSSLLATLIDQFTGQFPIFSRRDASRFLNVLSNAAADS